ncbi:MAG TPA: hypothetical protein VJ302_01385, partial [Blastocatellia bacterium]|nr:hypothetical protein [Blastocatellia bacterium]
MSIERTAVNPPRRILRIWLAACLIPAAVCGLARAQSTIQGNQGDKPAGGQATGTINGRILVSDGGNAARATVALRSVGDGRGSGGQTVLTDEEGNFQFKDLPPRSYRIFAYGIPGYVQAPTSLLENELTRYYHIGDHATINFIRGGAITGRVTDAGGLPVIDVQVSATMKRDAEGNPVPARSMGVPRYTDDRGVYRLYGLVPGTYVIAANKGPNQLSGASPYEGQVPTYYPSSTIDTAGEITVGSGGEVSGADIRYLGSRGQTVSGKILNGDPVS